MENAETFKETTASDLSASAGYVWKVKYESTFTGTQGMEEYSIDQGVQDGCLVSRGDSISDVEQIIRDALGPQYSISVVEATYIGRSIN